MENEELLHFSIRRKVHKINSYLKNNWDVVIEEIRQRCAKYGVELPADKLRLIESEIYSFAPRFDDKGVFVNITIVIENISLSTSQFVSVILHSFLEEQGVIDESTSISIIDKTIFNHFIEIS